MPRSGWAVARGVAANINAPIIYSNQGAYADKTKPALDIETLKALPSNVLVVDNLLWEGKASRRYPQRVRRI